MPTGMTPMVPSASLTITDICRIIKECRRNEIISFKFGELELLFNDNRKSLSLEAPHPTVSVPVVDKETFGHSVESVESSPGQESFALQSDLEALEAIEEAQLMIDDPSAHEALMIDRNLNPHRDDVNGGYRSIRA